MATQESLSPYLKISALLHVGIFLAFTVQILFFIETPIQYEKAIRVDLVGLPDKVSPPPPGPKAEDQTDPKTEAKIEPKVEPKKEVEVIKLPPKPTEPDAISLQKTMQTTKIKQKSAMEKLKQMEALDAIQDDLEKEKKSVAIAAAKVKYKGNVLSPGTELTGINKLQADTYIDDVHRHMLNHWTLPEYLRKRKFRTDVLVKFDENGNILEKALVKSSGNGAFDEFVLAAIQKSSPVPAPPSKFVRISSIQGFLFRFSDDI